MRKKLFFKNSRGIKLCGILSGPKDKNYAVILCHGFSSSKNSKTYKLLEKMLNKKKISTFRFDFFGHGESGGKFGDITISEGVDDILNAIKFLKNLGYKKIGLMGSSFGGITSLIAASKTKKLSVLALRAPAIDVEEIEKKRKTKKELEEWKNKEYTFVYRTTGEKLKLNYSYFEDIKKNNGYKSANKIKIPTLIIHGSRDETVPIAQSKKASQLIKNCELVIIKGAGHGFSKKKEFNKCLKLIANFIIKHS